MTNAPNAAPEPWSNGVTVYQGFKLSDEVKAVLDWQFQYCTNAI